MDAGRDLVADVRFSATAEAVVVVPAPLVLSRPGGSFVLTLVVRDNPRGAEP